MKRKIELLAPGGDIDAIKAAIVGGADAVYCGLNKFNARNRATNISLEELQGILRLAHQNNCQVFLTLNIIIVESEIPALITLLNKLVNTSIDGIIIQDLGLFYILSKYFKSLKIHASTQLTTHNIGQIKFLKKLNTTRINLSRELNIHEIKTLTSVALENKISTEVFVHGSFCISFSGICYMSSVHGGNSGNRGRCSQTCRDRYIKTAAGKDYPLNLKDNSAYFDLKELVEAGVGSLKIEGRIKKSDYVYMVVNTWKKHLGSFYDQDKPIENNSDLYKVFNRDFSNSFLTGELHKDMFIDDPRDFSIQHLSEINDFDSADKMEESHLQLYAEKESLKTSVEKEINKISIQKAPVSIHISGGSGELLKVSVKTPDTSFEVFSEIKLVDVGTEALNYELIFKRLKAINDTEFYIHQLNLEEIKSDLYLPFKELTSIKKKLLFTLNGSREFLDPITIPGIMHHPGEKTKPGLSVIISSSEDIELCKKSDADIYFQIPAGFKNEKDALTALFLKNKKLIPYFPSVLIGDDYIAAVEFLKKINPKLIVTNNTGIAYEAYKQEIQWIAGPYLNIVNSYSLLCLKENFNCTGAFFSNEINKEQIRNIKKPENFKLYYSIYHPIVLMTSRQCLFHQVSGCEKHKIENTCIRECEKSSTITNLKKQTFYIEKSKGNYHRIYNESNFLNTAIVEDFPNHFSSFSIDLSDIKTKTHIELDKWEIVQLFENFLKGVKDAANELSQKISSTTNTQYKKGI